MIIAAYLLCHAMCLSGQFGFAVFAVSSHGRCFIVALKDKQNAHWGHILFIGRWIWKCRKIMLIYYLNWLKHCHFLQNNIQVVINGEKISSSIYKNMCPCNICTHGTIGFFEKKRYSSILVYSTNLKDFHYCIKKKTSWGWLVIFRVST